MRMFRNAIRTGVKYYADEGFIWYSSDKNYYWSYERPIALIDEPDWVLPEGEQAIYIGQLHRYYPPLLPWWEMVIDLSEHYEVQQYWSNQFYDKKGKHTGVEQWGNQYF